MSPFCKLDENSAELRTYHSPLTLGNLIINQQRERGIIKSLRNGGVTPQTISTLRVLEVGCGTGGLLPLLVYYGATPKLLSGVDLDRCRIQEARLRFPNIQFCVGDVTTLPLPTDSFDIVVQSTLFTSLLDPSARSAAAGEMKRVLRPGGFILWFDFRYNNPRNHRVRRVTKRELVRELFPEADVYIVRTVLLPPLARWLAPFSWILAELLALIPPLCSHYCALIRPTQDIAVNDA